MYTGYLSPMQNANTMPMAIACNSSEQYTAYNVVMLKANYMVITDTGSVFLLHRWLTTYCHLLPFVWY